MTSLHTQVTAISITNHMRIFIKYNVISGPMLGRHPASLIVTLLAEKVLVCISASVKTVNSTLSCYCVPVCCFGLLTLLKLLLLAICTCITVLLVLCIRHPHKPTFGTHMINLAVNPLDFNPMPWQFVAFAFVISTANGHCTFLPTMVVRNTSNSTIIPSVSFLWLVWSVCAPTIVLCSFSST